MTAFLFPSKIDISQCGSYSRDDRRKIIGMKRAVLFFTMVTSLFAAGLLSCTDDAETTVPSLPAEITTTSLNGTQWELVTINGKALIEGTYISLYFRESGRIWGFAGCNFIDGTYDASDDEMLHFNEMIITLLGCPSPEGVLEQEKAFIDALGAETIYSLGSKLLVIHGDGGEEKLVFQQLPEYAMDPADLIGTRWRLVSVNGEYIETEIPVTISFDSDSIATGRAGIFEDKHSYDASGDDIWWHGSQVKTPVKDLTEQELEAVHYAGIIVQGANYVLTPDKLEIFTYRGDVLVYSPLAGDNF